jgi:hypothetical protein
MIRALPFLLAAAAPVEAETALVYSGEHGAFTRLVIELPADSDWTVGRTSTGYAFALKDAGQPDYDMSSVWQRISRLRATALQVDPESGALLLDLGCDCHVFPFEYRPGAIVLDIKPGPPPAGSIFEAEFQGELKPASLETPETGTAAASYSWLRVPALSKERPPTAFPLPLATEGVSLEPLRDALLEQIARGAADGIVDMDLPHPEVSSEAPILGETPWSNVLLGEHPGILVTDPDAFVAGPGPIATCPDDKLLDVAAWGSERSPIDVLATARADIFGEFDIADADAVLQSVRSHLYLGFGAEATQVAGFADVGTEDEVLALYRSMARIVDGEADPDTPFATTLDCDGPAALWAALARDRLPSEQAMNRDAILRSFLALPPHLRAHLGSELAEKFLASDDPDAVQTIRDAMERTPHIDLAAVAMLDAESELHRGNSEAARAHAEEAVMLEGNTPDALVTLVETHFRALDPISPEVAETLIAGRGEIGDAELADKIDRAITLALALSGQTAAAFESPGATGAASVDLWQVVLDRATDDDFLRHSVLPGGSPPPKLEQELGLKISRRLMSLGFPDSALSWLGTVSPSDSSDRRVTAARAFLAIGDAQTAVNLLKGLAGSEASTSLAEALLAIGDLAAAQEVLAANGQTAAAARTSLWQGHWSASHPDASDIWQTAAAQTQPAEPDSIVGPLGQGALAIEASATSRAAIEALLRSVAQPAGG